MRVDKISDIISDLSEENISANTRYKDKGKVLCAGIITAKKTKTLKNGDTMAFINLEDKFGEIEVIVFAKQYSRFVDEIFEENAVSIEGNISEEEGEAPKILLSNITALKSNSDMELQNTHKKAPEKAEGASTLYIKIDGFDDKRIASITRMALLNGGKTNIVVYDVRTKKYNAMKDVKINPSDAVIERLRKIFGDESVVLR
jgi:DNA polymerase-3 subunit alpha